MVWLIFANENDLEYPKFTIIDVSPFNFLIAEIQIFNGI